MSTRTRPLAVLALAVALPAVLLLSGCSGGDDSASTTTKAPTTTVASDDFPEIDENGVDNTIPAEVTPEMSEFLALICTLPQEQPDASGVQAAMSTAIAVVRRGAEVLGAPEGLDTSGWPKIADDFEAWVATQTPEQLLAPDESVEAVTAFGDTLSSVLQTRVDPCPEI